MPLDAVARSVAHLPQRKIWQRYAFAFDPVKLSLFAIGYLVACGYGSLFLQTASAALWFPDSVLLCALLLTSPNEWWVYLAIAVPIRLILTPHLHPAVPLWFVIATSANDLIKATFAAYLLRRLPNGSSHPSTMPQLGTFLGVSVFVVPVLSAFAGAATRHLLGYAFWVSWYQWFLGDALANVVLTPALLYWSSKRFRALRVRTAELGLWIAGFMLSITLALTLAHSAYSPIAVCVPVPFLIWAATRFGLIGASTALSVIALLGTVRIAEKTALFSMGFESKSLIFLQLFLFVVSIPVLCIATVIEEKDSVEKSLRDSEQRLRLAAQAARIGTFEWNIQTGVNTWTRELEAMYGLPPGGFGGTQTAFENLVHPDDRTRVIELDNWALKTGQPTEGEWRVVWADGSMHWIAGRWQVFMNDSGEPSRMVGINIDITDRKRAEQELGKANERLRLALEAGSAGGWDYDLKTGKSVWFGTAQAQLGMTPDETSGSRKEFWDRIHEDDRERVEHALQVAKKKHKEYAEDVRVVWRDGTTRWLRSRGRFQYDANGEAERSLGISLDITEQKLADEARFRHAAIVESSEDAIISKNRDAVITSWNAGAERIFGYAESEAVGEPITILIPPELQDEEKTILEKLRAGERIEHYETIRVTKAGRKVEVSLSISPIKDSGGNIMGFSKIARDITKRKQAEQDLLSSEQRYRLLFERNVAGVAIASLDGRLLDCNDGWVHILGYEAKDELLGQASEFYFSPAERKALVDELFEKQVLFSRELQLRRKDGTTVWVLFNAAVFHSDRDTPIMQATMTDISEWKRAQEALRASEGRLRLAQQSARLGTFERDVRTGGITWAEGLEPLYGLPPGSLDGKTPAFFERLIHPDDRERAAHLIQEALKTGQPTEGEWRAMWPDGTVHWIAGRWQVLMDDSGVPSRVVGVNMDVTERKLAEQSLADMTRKLVEAQEQERARIARDLHDDINQRLALLSVELGQLRDNPSEVASRLQKLQRVTSEIASDVHALSHELHSSKLEYLGVVAGMKSWCKEFAERQGMRIDCRHDVRGTLPQEIGLCLFRVLQEALHNASKHSGVKQVDVQLREDSGGIHLIVSDRGRGFNVKEALQGKGLGLTSMRERVRLMKGTIEIQSKPMGGTSIHARVPFELDHAQKAAG